MAALFAAAFRFRRSPRAGWVLAAAVLSHWLLDVISHRPDMPLAPGVDTRLGLGLWTSVPATIVVEGGFWLTALLLYARATRSRSRVGSIVFLGMLPLLTLIWYNNIAGPPPADPKTAPIGSLVFFAIVVAWAYGVERLRSTIRVAKALES